MENDGVLASPLPGSSREGGSARHGQAVSRLTRRIESRFFLAKGASDEMGIAARFQMDPDQRERYLTLRIIEIRTRDGCTGDTFSGPRGAVEVFVDNPHCDVTVIDPRRIPWWNSPMSSGSRPTRRRKSGEAKP